MRHISALNVAKGFCALCAFLWLNWFNTEPMTKKLALLVTCALLLTTECSPARLKIGVFLSMTGATSAYGVSAANAFNMAADELNQAGGVKGTLVDLEIEDDHSNTDEVPGVVNHLIKEHHVKALLAEPVSVRALAAAPIAQQNQIVMISSASVKPELTISHQPRPKE